jgi:hypothetical protein
LKRAGAPIGTISFDLNVLSLAERIDSNVRPLITNEPYRGDQKAEVNDPNETLTCHGKFVETFAMTQVKQVRISAWIVGKLMMTHVKQAVEMNRSQ